MLKPLLLAALLAVAPVALALGAGSEQRGTIHVTRVPLDPNDPARTRTGALRYLGGWMLASRDRRFGGLSALHVDDRQVRALNDAGTYFSFARPQGTGTLPLAIRDLPAFPGAGGKADRDSESLAVTGAGVWVGFEQKNCLWLYDRQLTRALVRTCPKAMTGWPVNGGPEAMAVLPDGGQLVFMEAQAGADGTRPALLFPNGPEREAVPLRYRAPIGHVPTDAAMLPDGRLLVLNRRVSLLDGWSAVLAIVDPTNRSAGAVLEARAVARLASPLSVDNMEGLAVTLERGRTIVWLASDDNFAPFQRTLLLKFALDPESPTRALVESGAR